MPGFPYAQAPGAPCAQMPGTPCAPTAHLTHCKKVALSFLLRFPLQVSFLKDLPPVDDETALALDFEYQTRAETLLAVDDMIEAVVQVCACSPFGSWISMDDLGATEGPF
jgi:hypothetical protein